MDRVGGYELEMKPDSQVEGKTLSELSSKGLGVKGCLLCMCGAGPRHGPADVRCQVWSSQLPGSAASGGCGQGERPQVYVVASASGFTNSGTAKCNFHGGFHCFWLSSASCKAADLFVEVGFSSVSLSDTHDTCSEPVNLSLAFAFALQEQQHAASRNLVCARPQSQV